MTKKKKSKTNLNDLAARVAKREGGKAEVNIAQIKEVMKCTFQELALIDEEDVVSIIEKYQDKEVVNKAVNDCLKILEGAKRFTVQKNEKWKVTHCIEVIGGMIK